MRHRVLRRLIPGLLTLSLMAAVPVVRAADYWVRTDGSDSCNGQADAPSGSGSCAFRSIAKANSVAGCGDTINIGAGTFYEDRITVSDACATTTPKVFAGAGLSVSTWVAGGINVDDSACTKDASNPNVYRCPKPAGTGTQNSPQSCLLQRYTEHVYWKDENSTQGDLVGPVCLTRNTNSAADVDGKEGNYYESTSEYFVRPWDDHDPRASGTAGTGLVAAVATCTSQSSMALRLTGKNIEIRDLELVSPCYVAIGLSGSSGVLLENLNVYGGTVWAYNNSSNFTYRRLKVRNALRRPNNTGTVTGTSWDTGSQCMATQGGNFTMEDVETYGCREGFSLSGGANNGTIDGLFVHGSFNHGIKIQDQTTHDILIRDALAYNNQEALFIECPYNITVENSTFPFTAPGGGVIIQGNPGGCAANRPSNLDFYNNIIFSMIWHNYGGDTWAKGGHDLDYNTYISDNGRSYVQRNVNANRSMNLASWQNWSSDPCSDCTRDPNGRSATRAEVFENWMRQDDRLGAGYDFDLRADSPVVGTASSSYGDAIDIEGVDRSTPRDPGAYDHTEGGGGGGGSPACSDGLDNDGDGATDYPADYGCSSATDTSEVSTLACGDGNDNDGDGAVDQADSNCTSATDGSESRCGDGVREAGAEQCDGSDLGGQTCVSRGYDEGTLACDASCNFDESACNSRPSDVNNLHRTDTR